MSPDAIETAVRRRVLAQLVSSLLYEGALRVETDGPRHTVPGRDGVRYVCEVRRAVGFDRVRVDGVLVRIDADGVANEADSPTRFLDEVRDAVLDGRHPAELDRFADEVERTYRHDVAAVRARRDDVDLLAADHDALEGLVIDGHRYHPAYKSRVGFEGDDNAAFGPEFLPTLHPRWVRVHRSIATVTGDDEDGAWVSLPVHPWQWRQVIVDVFATEIAAGTVVDDGEDPDVFTPQQSIRTLSCRDDPARATLKTALSIVTTSTRRTLAPHTVGNAASISAWLHGIVARDPFLRDVIVLREFRGVSVAGADPAAEGALAAIWRDPLPPRLAPGERAVPGTALTATDRAGVPLVAGWLERHGAAPWVGALVDAVALPLVHLLVVHGVAVETHAQNMSVVLHDGLPRRVALKDFHDGVRFSRRLLADPDAAPTLAAPPAHHANRNSFVETDDPALVRDFLLDAFFFVNLGELGLLLHEHGLLEESVFWGIVAARVRAHVAAHSRGAFDLFVPTLAVEKLTTRRLTPDTELALHEVPNPLHRFDPGT